jgi:hypothetical protein
MMRRLFLTFALVAATALPALAAPGLTFLPQAAGQRVAYRIVRNVQTLAGQQTTTSTFTVVRRAGTTLVIERTGPNGAPNLSVLKTNPDGSLALADARTTSDGDLADLLYGLNLAIDATREGDPSAGGTWLAVVPVSPAPGATSAPVVLVPSTNGKTTFDFSGSADTSSAPPAPARNNSQSSGGIGGGGFPGGGGGGGVGGGFPGGGGGGFPGGGGGRRGRGGDSNGPDGGNRPSGSSSPIALTIHIDGHASNGAANRITITQMRTVTIANMPYVNVGSWTVTVQP